MQDYPDFKLHDKIIPLPNIDKDSWHEKYYEDRNEEPTSFSVSSSIHRTSSDRFIKIEKLNKDGAEQGK